MLTFFFVKKMIFLNDYYIIYYKILLTKLSFSHHKTKKYLLSLHNLHMHVCVLYIYDTKSEYMSVRMRIIPFSRVIIIS